MNSAVAHRLALIERDYPEWHPWLVVIAAVLDECQEPRWQAWVPQLGAAPSPRTPLLTGVSINIDGRDCARWIDRLFGLASMSGNPAFADLHGARARPLADHGLAMLQASLTQEHAALEQLAASANLDRHALGAVCDLLAVPLLHACRRQWSALLSDSWTAGYCPLCGAWPALAEELGIERSRCLCCARCGASWSIDCLRCPYCENTEHEQLATLVQADGNEARRVETCQRCRGYIKLLRALQTSAAEEILLADLASVDLDLAALEQGFVRPANPGFATNVSVAPTGANRIARSRS